VPVIQYRREIDGLRAVAVLPVILFHGGFHPFTGGYVGVDVFFVISGYLITSILIRELQQGTFSILHFYERRARRILPALFVVMLACLPFAYAWMVPSQFISFAQSLVSVVLFVSNIFFWYQGEAYFAAEAELQPLLHTWSLAVEEQYYLLFPVFLLLVWRFGRQPVFWSVVAIAAISLVMAEWGSRNAPSASFYLAPSRAWELLAGSICAFLAVGRPQRSSNMLSAIGLALIVYAILWFDADTPFPGLYALVPVIGTALIILFAARETWVARLLSTRAFVGIGLISYSAYLWHQPLFAFARLRSPTEPDALLIGGLSVASLLLVWATWHYVEQPFRRRPVPVLPTRRGVFAWSGTVAALIGAIGVTGHFGHGFAWRFSKPAAIGKGMFDMPHLEKGFCFYSIADNRRLAVGEEGLECFLTTDGEANVLLFGDSHAAQWEPFWEKAARQHEFVLHSVNTNWCFPAVSDAFKGPVTSRAREHCFYIREWLRENHDAYDVIILAGGWEAVTTQRDEDGVRGVFDEILENGTARIVVMPHPIPVRRTNVERVVYGLDDRLEINWKALAKIQAVEAMLVRHYADEERVVFLDCDSVFGDHFSSAGLLTADGLPYSFDGGHISIYGSLAAWENFVSRTDDQAFVEQLLKN
jgi:peptidoglycan/LPS O-acetylase OafA/YrhL